MNTLRTSTLALACSLALGLAACGGGGSAPELIGKAKESLAAGDAKAAQIHLKNALQRDGTSAEARFLLGRLLLDANNPVAALVELDKAASAGYPQAELVPVHARALLEGRESRKLIERYAATELQDPKAQADLLVLLSRAQQRLDKPTEARTALDRALKLVPGHTSAEVDTARMEAGAGDMDGAMRRAEALVVRAAQSADAWRLLGDLQVVHKKDPAAARSAYEKAVAAAPKSLEAHQALISHLLGMPDLVAAEAALKVANGQVGKPPVLQFLSATMEMERGRLDPAHEQVQALLKIAPEDGRIALLAGQIEYLRERYAEAESHLARALALPGSGWRARLLLTQTYLRLQDAPRALQALQPMLELPEKHPRVLALAGEAHLLLGETRRAEDYFRQAAALDPKDMRSRTLLALGQVNNKSQEARGLAELRELSTSFESPVADLALVHTFIRKGDVNAALEAIDAIEHKSPGKGLAPMLRAQVLRAQGKLQESDAALHEALKRDPKYLPAALFLARQDLAAKQPERAVQRVAAVVKADPDNAVTRLAWLNLREQAGEAPATIEAELKELVKQQPQLARVRQALATAQLRQGRLADALATAQQSVAALPTEAALVEQLAELQLRSREWVLAAKTLEQLADLRPSSPEPLVRLAELERQRERPREALAHLKKAVSLRANHGPAQRLLVLVEAELGNVEQARRLVKDIAAIPGLEAHAAATEGDLEYQQQQWGVAESAYRRALARNATLPDVPAKLLRVLHVSGKKAEADSFARDWVKDHPRDYAVLNYQGDSALNQRDNAGARAYYERSLAIYAEQPLVMNNLAWILQQQGDLKRAEKLVRDAQRFAPGEAALHDTLSGILSAAGQHESALAAQRQALQFDSNAVYRVNLARRLLAAGRKDAARDELQAVKQLGDRYPGQAEVTELLGKV